MHRLLPVLSALALCLPTLAPAQISRNVALGANYRPPTQPSAYSSIWGYVDPPTGKEYAILGSTLGTHIVDCTDPTNPIGRGRIDSANPGDSANAWREMKTYGRYCYSVSEAHGGMQIIDLTNPDQPALVRLWGNWSNTHTITVDVGAGIAYASGTNRGVVIVNVRTNPANPTELGTFPSPYIHDCAVENGYAYFCAQNSNTLRIYDAAASPTLPELSRIGLPGTQIAHNCWPTRDGTICVTTNETAGGPVGIFNISDKRFPALISTWRVNPQTAPNAIPHNAYIVDHVVHLSYYTEGYRAVDISDPANPVEVGYYDTHVGGSSGFAGAWGCYHAQPSGNIYISDIQGGLFVLKPKATTVAIGAPTVGTGGVAPELHTFGAAWRGNSRFALQIDKAKASTPSVLFISPNQLTIALQGLNIHVDLGPGVIALPFTTGALGRHTIPLPIAATIGLGTVYLQAMFQDPGSASTLGLSATRGMKLEVFDR
jgi:choice-of-anchor B domain-containing protein